MFVIFSYQNKRLGWMRWYKYNYSVRIRLNLKGIHI